MRVTVSTSLRGGVDVCLEERKQHRIKLQRHRPAIMKTRTSFKEMKAARCMEESRPRRDGVLRTGW